MRSNCNFLKTASAVLLLSTSYAVSAALPDFTGLVEKNSAAVVKISAIIKPTDNNLSEHFAIPDLPDNAPFNEFFRKFFEHMPENERNFRQPPSQGSGFIISEQGYVITNNHVINEAEEVLVRLNDRREFVAEVIGTDERSDIAVLKIDGKNLPVLTLGSSADLKVGEWVLAIGSPFGFDYSVTQGIVSSIGRNLPNDNYVPFIQTDVAINPGNSGGPLFNLDGEVVGVNSQIFSGTGGYMGVSFAVPIDVVKNVYAQLRDKGRVSRGWLGVLIQDVTGELAESFEMSRPMGALIAKIMPDSPADTAGFEIGDIIVRYDGSEINTSSDLPPLVGGTAIDTKVKLDIIRRGKKKTLRVLIAELPEPDNNLGFRSRTDTRDDADNALKIVIQEPSDAMRRGLDIPENSVLVKKVMQGPAREAGIREGDIILMINNIRLEGPDHFNKIQGTLPRNKSIPILIQRMGSPTFLALRLE
ncbi:MAG: Do family serine endopeptidase [Gammaproteobacteria bacterium]